MFLVHVLICLYHYDDYIKNLFFIRYMDRKHLVDVTEIFRQLNWEKKYRMIKLAFYFSLFIITIYRFDFSSFFIHHFFIIAYAYPTMEYSFVSPKDSSYLLSQTYHMTLCVPSKLRILWMCNFIQ